MIQLIEQLQFLLSVIMWLQIASLCIQLITFVRKVSNDAKLNEIFDACGDDDDIDDSEAWKYR